MNYRYVFFGTPHIAAASLEALQKHDLLPALIVTAPARPQGRGMHVMETPVAAFAHAHNIPLLTPEKISADVIADLHSQGPWDFFLVVAYGKILPSGLLDIANGKVINLHPSLLPHYRGPSPLESVLLSDDTETGVSIMKLDALVDHGPIIAQTATILPEEETIMTLTEKSAETGIDLFIQSLEGYISGARMPFEQDHSLATITRKYTKADGLLDDSLDDWQKWKLFRAFGDRGWVHSAVERHGKPTMIKITKASYVDDAFVIEEVIPENGKRQSYESFLQSL
jgi:methionyl-tRNA formyltransferase